MARSRSSPARPAASGLASPRASPPGRQYRAQRLRRPQEPSRRRGPSSPATRLSSVVYSAADMSKPGRNRGHDGARRKGVRPRRHPGQQCRHPACRSDRGFPAEKWDAIIAINLSAAFHATRLVVPAMKTAEMGPHHQHRLGACAGRLALQVGLCRRQAWPRRLDQDGGAGGRHAWHHRQRHLPGLCLTPLVEKQIPDRPRRAASPRRR